MPGAIIALDQDRAPSPTSFGSPGVARKDLWQSRLITCRSTSSGNTSYSWTFLAIPPGSAATLSGALTANATFTPDLPGSYRVQLTTNGGGPGNVQTLIAGVRFDVNGTQILRGWLLPAFGEVAGEDNFLGQLRGWADSLEFIFNDILSALGGGGDIGFIPVKQPVTTANYTYLVTDYCVPVDSTGGVFALTIPAAQAIGKAFRVDDAGGACGTHTVTINAPGGETITGSTTFLVASNYASYTFTKVTATKWSVS